MSDDTMSEEEYKQHIREIFCGIFTTSTEPQSSNEVVNEHLILSSIRKKDLKLKDSEGNEYTVAKLNINNQFKTNQKEAKQMNQNQPCWKTKEKLVLSNDDTLMHLLDRINVGFSSFVSNNLNHYLKNEEKAQVLWFLGNMKEVQNTLHDDCNVIVIPDYIAGKLNAMFNRDEKEKALEIFNGKIVDMYKVSSAMKSLETSLNAFAHIIKSNSSLGVEVGLSHMVIGDSNIFTAVEKLIGINNLNKGFSCYVKSLMEAFFKTQNVLENQLIIPKSIDYLKLMSSENGALDGLIFEFFKSSFTHVSVHLKDLVTHPKYRFLDMHQNPFYAMMLESQERQKNIPNPLPQGQQMGIPNPLPQGQKMGIPNPLPQGMCPPQWQQMGYPNPFFQGQQMNIPNPLPQGAYPNHVPQWQQTSFVPQRQQMGIPTPPPQNQYHNPFNDMSFVFQNPQTQGYQTEIPNPSTQGIDPNPSSQEQQMGIPNPPQGMDSVQAPECQTSDSH